MKRVEQESGGSKIYEPEERKDMRSVAKRRFLWAEKGKWVDQPGLNRLLRCKRCKKIWGPIRVWSSPPRTKLKLSEGLLTQPKENKEHREKKESRVDVCPRSEGVEEKRAKKLSDYENVREEENSDLWLSVFEADKSEKEEIFPSEDEKLEDKQCEHDLSLEDMVFKDDPADEVLDMVPIQCEEAPKLQLPVDLKEMGRLE